MVLPSEMVTVPPQYIIVRLQTIKRGQSFSGTEKMKQNEEIKGGNEDGTTLNSITLRSP